MKPRVVVLFPLEPELEARLEERCEITRLAPAAPRAELIAALAEAEGLLLSNQRSVDATLLEAAPRLRVVSGNGVGYDRFDVDEATRRGVAICYTPDVVTEAVVHLTLGLLLAASRRLFENESYVRSGGWARREPPPGLGFDLRGKTLGIVGLGRIGCALWRSAGTFGMHTLWNDVFDSGPAEIPSSEYRSLDALLAESDLVTLHVDLNPGTEHLIGAAELARMKPSAWLINTSRGRVVDAKALGEALRSGAIAGAALDVLEQEPPSEDDSLLDLANLIAFPHMGTATEETRYAMRELTVRNLLAVLAGEPPPACVNPLVLTA